MKNVSIIMLAYNKVEYSKLTIESLYKYTSHIDFQLITVNDGSTDGTKQYFDTLPHKDKINFEENKGGDVGFNEALKLSEGKYTVFINNDLILTPNWLDNLIYIMESDSKIGVAVPACNSASNLQTVGANYSNEVELIEFARKYNVSDNRKWDERLRLMLYVAIFRTSQLKEFGGVDEIYSPGGFDDDDLTYRYRRAGLKLIFARDTYVHHFGSVTIGEKYSNLLVKNREIFKQRFGVDSWSATAVEFEILDSVTSIKFFNKKTIKLLGIGNSCANTLLFIKNSLKEKYVDNIKLDYYSIEEKYIVDLNTICNNVFHDSLSNITNNILNNKYNLIYIDLTIDNISNMSDLLKTLTKNLEDDGVILLRYQRDVLLRGFIIECGYENVEFKEYEDMRVYIGRMKYNTQ